MNLHRFTLVTRRRDGRMSTRRYLTRRRADRAYREASASTYMGDNPIIEVWYFKPRERTTT